jgi:DNA-binding transcriptional regulator YiaG
LWHRPDAQSRVAFLLLIRLRLKALKPTGIPKDPQTLGEHIKKRRLELGLTQGEASAQIGVSPWNILNWETGHCDP